jgi:hypothetical protein
MDKLNKKEGEKVIFDAFIKVEPNFAGEKVTCSQCDQDPPDFICDNNKGKIIGIELVTWLNEPQTRRSREFDYLERQINQSIPLSKDCNVSIFPKEDIFPNNRERSKFIDELTDILKNETVSQQNYEEELYLNDFDQYPILREFVKGIMIDNTKLPLGFKVVRGEPYSPEDAIKALQNQIKKKMNKNNYMTLKNDLKLNELYLIVYYWMALLWNSPYESPDYDLNDIVEHLKMQLGKTYTFFDKIYLFRALEPDMRVFNIYP